MRRPLRAMTPALAIFWMAAKRLWNNRRLTAGLLVGFCVAIAAASAIPVFTAGALHRVLQRDLATAVQRMPVAAHLSYYATEERPTTAVQFEAADRFAREAGPDLIGLPLEVFARYGSLDVARIVPVDPTRIDPAVARWMTLAFSANLFDQIRVTDGRLPTADRSTDGFFEVIVQEETLSKQDFTVGAEFFVPLSRAADAPRVQVRVVGAFVRLDWQDPVWSIGADFDQVFFLPEETFRQAILPVQGAAPYHYAWFYGVASESLQMTDLLRYLDALQRLEVRIAQFLPDTRLTQSPVSLLSRYALRAALLNQMMLWLLVPTLVTIIYFVMVTAGLMVDRQRQEIAVLRSRGASLPQIAGLYLLEGILLAIGALVIGLPLGLLLARAIGASNGFLQFVIRKSVSLLPPPGFLWYGLGAAILAVAAYVLPAVLAARQSITAHKQEEARQLVRPVWARFGLDWLCLGLAAYGYLTLRRTHPVILELQAQGGSVGAGATPLVEPLHILAPALLIFGAGLLLMRLFPLLLRAVARLVARWAGAPLYLALMQLSRAPNLYTPVILLLTLTVGMGLYSAATARTFEQNSLDRVRYELGTDVVVTEAWEYIDLTAPQGAGSPGAAAPVTMRPPPWHIHYSLPGVVHAARVRTENVTALVGGREQGKGSLMAIDPDDFGKVAWYRRDLAPHHLNRYLNLLAADEEGLLVSRAFLERNRLVVGDWIALNSRGREVNLFITGAIEYWPTLYPHEGDFFIANLDYMEQQIGLAQAQVWLRMEPDARLQPVVDAIRAEGIGITRVQDARQELILARRDPQLAGLLGGLTSGFMLATLISLLGFWLFAALSARARVLQFGVLRALGLSVSQLVGTVALEQILAVLTGVAAGTGLGMLSSRLFIPFLQQGADAASRTPPFLVVVDPTDQARLYLALAVMLIVGLGGLMLALARLRVHEAVKLGEDS